MAFDVNIAKWPLAHRMAYRFITDPEVVQHMNDKSVDLIRDDRIMTDEDEADYYDKRLEVAKTLLDAMKQALDTYY